MTERDKERKLEKGGFPKIYNTYILPLDRKTARCIFRGKERERKREKEKEREIERERDGQIFQL